MDPGELKVGREEFCASGEVELSATIDDCTPKIEVTGLSFSSEGKS